MTPGRLIPDYGSSFIACLLINSQGHEEVELLGLRSESYVLLRFSLALISAFNELSRPVHR